MGQKFENRKENWLKYGRVNNNDGTIDLIIPKDDEQKTIRLSNYQIDFLAAHYLEKDFSSSLRKALDDLIKSKEPINQIQQITTVIR